jgi:uncharacterized protein (DUF433 family)
MKGKTLLKRIECNPKIMFGKPVIKGTRMPVELILEKLAYGYTPEMLIKEYPFLSEQDIKAALLFAARNISLEEIVSI